jgi:hypothetical protein
MSGNIRCGGAQASSSSDAKAWSTAAADERSWRRDGRGERSQCGKSSQGLVSLQRAPTGVVVNDACDEYLRTSPPPLTVVIASGHNTWASLRPSSGDWVCRVLVGGAASAGNCKKEHFVAAQRRQKISRSLFKKKSTSPPKDEEKTDKGSQRCKKNPQVLPKIKSRRKTLDMSPQR